MPLFQKEYPNSVSFDVVTYYSIDYYYYYYANLLEREREFD